MAAPRLLQVDALALILSMRILDVEGECAAMAANDETKGCSRGVQVSCNVHRCLRRLSCVGDRMSCVDPCVSRVWRRVACFVHHMSCVACGASCVVRRALCVVRRPIGVAYGVSRAIRFASCVLRHVSHGMSPHVNASARRRGCKRSLGECLQKHEKLSDSELLSVLKTAAPDARSADDQWDSSSLQQLFGCM